MPPMTTTALLALVMATVQPTDWVALRWQAANGPRDIEFHQPSVKMAARILSVSVRRERATVLKQDPTIAPETNPWTAMDLQVNCTEGTWRMTLAQAVDANGKLAGVRADERWQPIQPASVAAAVRMRLCPSA